ncbi:MAG: DUF4332 domain-containing protein [Promethearchaeota archaeon]|nr:MAG: DUF4332 domain-containing protein [Candidatus Lokiarchaeota archaeon]
MNLTEIFSLEEKDANSLKKEGIKQVEDLIPLSRSQIHKLAEKTKIDRKLIDTWQEHADLMRLDGVTPAYAYLINSIGIDSVKEFSLRNPKNTLVRMKEFAEKEPEKVKPLPTLEQIEKWVEQANIYKQKYGEYGKTYWVNKWVQSPILYRGRALRGDSYNKVISIDVKAFIFKNDEILNQIIDQFNLKKGSVNETALTCQQFVSNNLQYIWDDINADIVEYWMFPFETIQSGIGDCEDGAILMAGLMINAGIPSWRVKVCAGLVRQDPTVAPSSNGDLGGHAYTIYLADRPDSERKLEWVILDWCYLADPQIPIEQKPLAREGGHKNAYKDIWFTFNDQNSWANTAFEVTEGRISKNQKAKKEGVLNSIKKILEKVDLQIKK